MEENGRLVQFLYNEDREVVAEKDCSGNIIRYIRGLGLISSDSENAKTYYHYVSDEQGSVSHIIRDEDKESGVSAQGREQDRILNQYEYYALWEYHKLQGAGREPLPLYGRAVRSSDGTVLPEGKIL